MVVTCASPQLRGVAAFISTFTSGCPEPCGKLCSSASSAVRSTTACTAALWAFAAFSLASTRGYQGGLGSHFLFRSWAAWPPKASNAACASLGASPTARGTALSAALWDVAALFSASSAVRSTTALAAALWDITAPFIAARFMATASRMHTVPGRGLQPRCQRVRASKVRTMDVV